MEILTKQQAEEARAACEAATVGPWKILTDGKGELGGVGSPVHDYHHADVCLPAEYSDVFNFEENLKFIAAARTVLPAALETIQAMEPLVEALAEEVCAGLQIPHLADFIEEELQSRNWTVADLAARFGGATKKARGIDLLALQMFLAVRDRNVLLGKQGKQIAHGFGVNQEFIENLHRAWREQPDCGNCPPCRARALKRQREPQERTVSCG